MSIKRGRDQFCNLMVDQLEIMSPSQLHSGWIKSAINRHILVKRDHSAPCWLMARTKSCSARPNFRLAFILSKKRSFNGGMSVLLTSTI